MTYALVLSKRTLCSAPSKRDVDVDVGGFESMFIELKASLAAVLSDTGNLVAAIYQAQQTVGPDDPRFYDLEDLLQEVASFNYDIAHIAS